MPGSSTPGKAGSSKAISPSAVVSMRKAGRPTGYEYCAIGPCERKGSPMASRASVEVGIAEGSVRIGGSIFFPNSTREFCGNLKIL